MKTLRIKQVKELTGLSRSSIYFYMKLGTFPKNFQLTARSVGWLEKDVVDWLKEKQGCAQAACVQTT